MSDRNIRSSEVAGPKTGEVRPKPNAAEGLLRQLLDEATRPVPLADDMLRGAAEIAEFVFGDRTLTRKAYHVVESGQIPSFRIGAVVCARKSAIVAWIEEQEQAAIRGRKEKRS